MFTPEVLKRGQTINISDLYDEKEIKAARSIKRMLSAEPPLLALGEVAVEEHLNAVSRLAKANPKGTFEDPTKNEYDGKLQDLEEKDHQEDLRTRKGYQGRS